MLYEYEFDLYRWHNDGDNIPPSILYHAEKFSKDQIIGFIEEIKKSLQTPGMLEKIYRNKSDNDFLWRLSTQKGPFFSTMTDMRPEIINLLISRYGFIKENLYLNDGAYLKESDADWIIDYKDCPNLPEIIKKCAEADNESYKRKLEAEIAEAQKKLARL